MADDEIIATVPDVVVKGRPVDFVEYDTTATRDAVVAQDLKAGIFCYVKQTGQIQKRNDANTGWDVVASATPVQARGERGAANGYASLDAQGRVPFAQMSGSGGNHALLASLTRRTQTLNLYVGPGGNDATGDGLTPATRFREVQRALDEIPSGGPEGHPSGIVQVNCAAGNYRPFVLKQIQAGGPSGGGLVVKVNGDTTVADGVFLFPVGVRPALVKAPSKVNAAQFDYDLGMPHGITFSEGSHWIDQQFAEEDGGPLSSFAVTVDGVKSALTPNKIRVANSYDGLHGNTVSVRPIVCTVDTTQDTTGVFFWNMACTNQNVAREPYFSGGVQLIVQGFKFVADYNIVFTGVSLQGCYVHGTYGQTNAYVRGNDDINYSFVANPDFLFFEGGQNVFVNGIFNAHGTFIIGPTSEFFVYGVWRGVDGNNVSLYLGGPTGGRIGAATDVEIEYAHFEAGFVDVQAAAARWGNHAPVSVDGATALCVARYGARQRFQTIVGATDPGVNHDRCVTLEAGCHVFDGIVGLNGNLVNFAHSGEELQLRDDVADVAPTNRAFSQGKITDTARLIRVGT